MTGRSAVPALKNLLFVIAMVAFCFPENPPMPGKMVDLGGHRLHVTCSGKGRPTIVVENGLGDFSFNWALVQSRVSRFGRICTYDRAGYAWSDPGPKPRTFAQLNLELRDSLHRLGEPGPYILVGHSYGGPVIRNFALTYPSDTAGLVFVDSAFEGEHVGIGNHKTIRLGDGAKGLTIPVPREEMKASDKPVVPANLPPPNQDLDPLYKVLSAKGQELQVWAQNQYSMYDAESSQTEWSTEYFAKWLASPQAGTLGKTPLLVLTRAEGGHNDDQDVPAAQLEAERKEGQAKLVQLSANSKQIIIHSGHNMELEAPNEVTEAIREIVKAIRNHQTLGGALPVKR